MSAGLVDRRLEPADPGIAERCAIVAHTDELEQTKEYLLVYFIHQHGNFIFNPLCGAQPMKADERVRMWLWRLPRP